VASTSCPKVSVSRASGFRSKVVPCAHCGATIRQTRGFQWEKPGALLVGTKPCRNVDAVRSDAPGNDHCQRCPVCSPEKILADQPTVGLLWVGEKFYPTADAWAKEASELGVSKRIAAIPKGLVVGKTWVFVAHPKKIERPCPSCKLPKGAVEENAQGDRVDCEGCKNKRALYAPGIFHAFAPTRIELIVTPSMEKQKWVKELVEKQGVTLVRVPEDDPDHAPTVVKKSARKKAMDRHARKLAKEGAAEVVADPGDPEDESM
jgi:ribosomal protein S27E